MITQIPPLLPGVPQWTVWGLAVVALVATALLEAADTALHDTGRSAVADLHRARRPRAAAVAEVMEHRERYVPGVRLLRGLAEVTAAVCITLSTADVLRRWWLILLVSVAIIALLLALVTGLGPRHLARRAPGRWLHGLLPLVQLAHLLTGPVRRFTDVMRPRRELTEEEAREEFAEDLRDAVDRVSYTDQLDVEESSMLQSVFDLGTTLVREVMVPRPDMLTVDADSRLSKALSLFIRSGFSRLPVIGDSVDDIQGVLYFKDVMRRTHLRADAGEEPVTTVMREAEFIPETVTVDHVLRRMQAESFHIGLVVDEYGGIAGLVTIEDLLEELVGELTDEHDRAEPEAEELGEGTWRVPARLSIDELGEIFDVEITDDDVDTVGGLLTKTLGKLPLPGDETEVAGLVLRAERTEGRRRQLATIVARRSTDPTTATEEK